jgi:hypothetical protein
MSTFANTPYARLTLTQNGDANGLITVADNQLFRVGAIVYLRSSTVASKQLVIDALSGTTGVYVRDPLVNAYTRFNASAYLQADSATLTQPIQGDFLADNNSFDYVTINKILTVSNTNPIILPQIATASLPAAASWPGSIVYDSTSHTFKFSNGTVWASPGGGGGGSGTVTGVLATSPLASDGDSVTPTISMTAAGAATAGYVTAGVQSFGGAKTFTGAISASNLSGTNTGDVSLAAVGAVPNANGASLSGQALNLQPADGTNPGVLTAGSQTIGGAKTFSGGVVSTNLTSVSANSLVAAGTIADGAGNIGVKITNTVSLANATAKIVSFSPDNGATEKCYIQRDGAFVNTGTASGSPAIAIPQGGRLMLDGASGTHYINWDGSVFNFAGGSLNVAGNITASSGSSISWPGGNGRIYQTATASGFLMQTEGTDGGLNSLAFSQPLFMMQANTINTVTRPFVVARNGNGGTDLWGVNMDGSSWSSGGWGGELIVNGLPTPVNRTFTQGAGTLAAGTYFYRVVAKNSTGVSLPSTETSLTITINHGVNVNWHEVIGATGYDVYGRTTGAELKIGSTDGKTYTFLDDGSVTPSGALPSANTSTTLKISNSGRFQIDATDSTGVPGNATINKSAGQVAVATGVDNVVVTNSLVTSSSIITCVLQDDTDAATAWIRSVVPTTGSFTIKLAAVTTGARKVGFIVHN